MARRFDALDIPYALGGSMASALVGEPRSTVDVFAVGDGLLDRRQIDRRVRVAFPGSVDGIWMTSPDDQILRKLTWLRDSDSGRQWRDVVGIVASVGESLDLEELRNAASEIGVLDLLDQALAEAAEE